MKPQSNWPQAWSRRSEPTVIVHHPPERARGVLLWFLVGALSVFFVVAVWRFTVVRSASAARPTRAVSGVILHPAKPRVWIDGARVEANSVALACGAHTIRAEATDAPLLLDVACPPALR